VWRKESDKRQFSDRLYKSDHISTFLAALAREVASESEQRILPSLPVPSFVSATHSPSENQL